ncbi:MAG: sugar phosphate isomerase/epimerase [Bacteroidales bacterium]|jgi:sugar phosphate isomerase/epimerase|nr:sugar phosphate isomerase/epimerase [Bacteroidales bacterium]
MNRLTRRQFIGKSAMGMGAALIASHSAADLKAFSPPRPVRYPLGFQVWTIREQVIGDFAGTMKMMAGMGYKSVEMCSPRGYELSGFGPLMKMPPREMKQIVNDNGMLLESTHYTMNELRNNLEERISFAAESGQKQMILSSFDLPRDATMSDWMRAADELNKIGEITKKAGIQTGFHNHHTEFGEIDNVLIYDALLGQFDAELVKMQFQVAVIDIGYKAADYFNSYPGRFISAHLADYSVLDRKNVALGKGIVDWKEFFASAGRGGLKNIFVEMDQDTFGDSALFIKNLQY